MNGNQATSQSTPDINTVHLPVEAVRPGLSGFAAWPRRILPVTTISAPTNANPMMSLGSLNWRERYGAVLVPKRPWRHEAGYEGFWRARCLERHAPDIEWLLPELISNLLSK